MAFLLSHFVSLSSSHSILICQDLLLILELFEKMFF